MMYQYYCPSCGYKREGLLDHQAIGIGSYSTLCPECGEHYHSYEVEETFEDNEIDIEKSFQ